MIRVASRASGVDMCGWYTSPMRNGFEPRPSVASTSSTPLLAVACVSAALLMIELALTRIFSVVMYYHFAFLAISIALFGLSASGVYAFLRRRILNAEPTERLLMRRSLAFAACTIGALFVLVRVRVGLNYSAENLLLMLAIYALASVPFFTGGLVVTLAITRFSDRVNAVYAADLLGAASGCVVLLPLLNWLGAPGVVIVAAALAVAAAWLFAREEARRFVALVGCGLLALPLAGHVSGLATFDVVDTKGHEGDRVLFHKWNSFSRIGVYERSHGDWSLSSAYDGPLPESRFMDIDSAASTPILRLHADLSNAAYLRYELTALAYQLREGQPFSALVIGPGGGRDLASALIFGAKKVDGVEINPIIAGDVMSDRFRDFSGGLYQHPKVHVTVDDGRSFVNRSPERYDVIQASLVDTWAATAAGAYTLTENTLYTVEAFVDYYDHLTDHGTLTITRWVFDGLRLVSLAQEACRLRGCDPRQHLAIIRHGRVATFLFQRAPFSPADLERLREVSSRLGFQVLYAPGMHEPQIKRDENEDPATLRDYARLIMTDNRQRFYAEHGQDISPTTDDRPFFFHTTKLYDQFDVAFGRTMLFGNGLSALLTLMGISGGLVCLFVVVPLAVSGGGSAAGWVSTLGYFAALGAGFMLIEVSVLQRFVLLLGHPVYSLTVTLFSLLLGTGLGAALSRRIPHDRLLLVATAAMALIALVAVTWVPLVTPVLAWAMPFSRGVRIAIAVGMLVPLGILLGVPMPAGLRLLATRAPQMMPWAWGINGALSVVGATLAIFIAMNWGFGQALVAAAVAYGLGIVSLVPSWRRTPPL